MSHRKPQTNTPPNHQLSQSGRQWDENVKQFDAGHGAHAFRKLDPLYALPTELLVAIQKEMPDWLTPSEIKFESDLAKLCARQHAVGIFYGRAVTYPLLNRLENTPQLEGLFRHAEADWAKYLNLEQFRRSMQVGFGNLNPVVEQSVGYIGWLHSNSMFLSERDRLRDRSAPIVEKLGAIPGYLKLTTEVDYFEPWRDDGKETRVQIGDEFNAFYTRWQIEGFATWDLPQPCGANLTGYDLPSARPPSVTRLSFEVASTIRLPARYPIQNAIETIQRDQTPEHLADWLTVQDQQHRNGLRYARFRQMFIIGYYRDTVLASRYYDRFAGNIEKLDRVFARFTDVGEDAVKKIRLQMSALRNQRS